MPLGGPPSSVRFDNGALDDLDRLELRPSFGADLQDLFEASPWPPVGNVVSAKLVPQPSHSIVVPGIEQTGDRGLVIYTYVENDEVLGIEAIELI